MSTTPWRRRGWMADRARRRARSAERKRKLAFPTYWISYRQCHFLLKLRRRKANRVARASRRTNRSR